MQLGNNFRNLATGGHCGECDAMDKQTTLSSAWQKEIAVFVMIHTH